MHALTEAVNNGRIFAYVSKPWDRAKLKAQVGAAVVHFNLNQNNRVLPGKYGCDIQGDGRRAHATLRAGE
jgi:response regulator RpfG family c-di-GMP phosphodiesterase